ncbi:MAG: PKD domain-containing protein [bacterium]
MKSTKVILVVVLILSAFPISANAITRDSIMQDAYIFSTASWTCITGNANTTYNYVTVGGYYVGIPYNWGGYESVARALYKLSTGAVAGDNKIFEDTHSNFAGVDCSGFVSTCWRAGRYTTSTIPNIATTINWSDLVRGDVTNKAGSHVRLFDYYTTGTNQIVFYESTAGVIPCRVVHRVLSKDTAYIPRRYKNIVETAAPVASFYASPTTGYATLTVNFYDSSSGSPTGWTWSFGDGTTATSQNPSHRYINSGKYTVTLIANNAYGASTVTKTNYITVNNPPAPICNFYASPTIGYATLTVNFYDTSSGSPTGWTWSFGDGTTATSQNPSHQYVNPGKYTVTLIANNAYGASTTTKTNYITVNSIYMNTYGEFTISSDTSHWYFEVYGDGTGAGTLSVDSLSQDIVIYQNSGEKGKLTQIFSVPSTGWYTAKARVWTTISSITKQQKVYLYLQELNDSGAIVATGNEVIQPGSGFFASAWNPKDMQISFYTQSTLLGVQLVAINPASSGIDGGLCADNIWVSPGAPQPTNTFLSDSFDAGTSGWIFEPYGDAASAGTWTNATSNLILSQVAGEKGKASYLFGFSTAGKNIQASMWIYSNANSINSTQKVYLYVYDMSDGFLQIIDSGNAILQSGKWTPGQWRQLQFGFKPTKLYNAVQLVGINPVGNNAAEVYFDNVVIKVE